MCRNIVGTTNLSRTIRAEGTDMVGDLRGFMGRRF